MTLPRRTFLSASAGLAATSIFCGARAGAAPLPREADIVVIGGGAARLAAARRVMAGEPQGVVGGAASHIGGGPPNPPLARWRAVGRRARGEDKPPTQPRL